MANDLPIMVELVVLRGKGGTEVVVTYSGSGDSGGIDEVAAFAKGEPIAMTQELQQHVETWAWEHAIPRHGWENNEGGHGTVTIDLETFEATIEHHEKYEEDATEASKPDLVLSPEVITVLEELKKLGFSELDVSGYSSDPEDAIRADEYDIDSSVSPKQTSILCEWFNEEVDNLDVGSAGGSCEVMLDLTTTPPTIKSVTHFTSQMLETEDTSTVTFEA
jgi:hypothetical protein